MYTALVFSYGKCHLEPFESYDSFYPVILLSKILEGERETPIPGTPIDYVNIYISMNLIISFNLT